MSEFAIANINADMGNAFAARIEEYEISCTQVVLGNFLAKLALIIGRMRQRNTELLKYIHRKARAVEAFGRRASCLVRRSVNAINYCVKLGVCESASCLESKQKYETQENGCYLVAHL